MSLQLAAQHLASRGRGPDTTLVHMAPQEVAGLQALAKAHGGSLTVNPDTGLPEAGILSSILPMALGFALGPVGLGMSAGMAGLTVGALGTMATGSLQKGLMAGLGAYGGAGLGAGLNAAAGTASQMAAPAGGLSSVGGLSMEQAAANAMQGAGGIGSELAGINTGITGAAAPTSGGLGVAAGSGGVGFKPVAQYGLSGSPLGAVEQATAISPAGTTSGASYALGPKPLTTAPITEAPSAFAKIGKGFEALGTEKGREAFLGQAASKGAEATGVGGYGGLARYGLAALSPALMESMQPKYEPYKGSGPNPYNFRFDWERPAGPSYDSREALQLRGNLRPITSMADGGPVEDMSQRNDVMTMMANGGMRFAEGGETEDPAKGMTGASADAFRYLMGQSAASPATLAAQRYATQQPVAAPAVVASPAARPLDRFRANFADTPFSILTNSLANAFDGEGEGGVISRAFRAQQDPALNLTFDPRTGVMRPVQTTTQMASGGIAGLAAGGQSHLGDYSDGGRLLRGPGDGISDSIPATIGDKRPARLADGEFVVPARIVSELGNGSTEAGARKLYAMMDRVQKARSKTTGKDRIAVNSRADKELPA